MPESARAPTPTVSAGSSSVTIQDDVGPTGFLFRVILVNGGRRRPGRWRPAPPYAERRKNKTGDLVSLHAHDELDWRRSSWSPLLAEGSARAELAHREPVGTLLAELRDHHGFIARAVLQSKDVSLLAEGSARVLRVWAKRSSRSYVWRTAYHAGGERPLGP